MNFAVVREAFGDATFTPSDVATLLDVDAANNQLTRWKQRRLIERIGRDRYRIGTAPTRPANVTLRRDAPKQRLLANLARRRWQDWIERGRVTPAGTRAFRYELQAMEAPPVRIRRV